jgi:hypothetical protein
MTKITKKEMYAAIKEAFETGACKFDKDTVIAFCDKEITALDNKAAKAKERAATKKAEADVLYDQVADALNAEEFQTIADIAAAVAEVNSDATVSKVTYRLTKLVEAGVAEKTDVTIPGGEGVKARKVKAFRKLA